MDLTAVGTLFSTTMTAFGGQLFLVLSGLIGLILAVFLFWYIVRKIKGSVK